MAREKEYRVTVETLDECYEYHVFATCKHDAIEEGEALAMNDGMGAFRMTWSTAERLS